MQASWISVAAVALALAGCGRIGYGVQEGPADSSPATDTGPATDTSVPTDAGLDAAVTVESVFAEPEAEIGRQPTFEVQPTRLPGGVTNAAACAEGTSVYVAGGAAASLSTSGCSSDFVVYGPDGAMTTMIDELPGANQGLGLVSDGVDMYSVMGFCGGATADESNVFRHPLTGPAELVGTFPLGAYYLSTGVVHVPTGGARIVVAGGYGSGPLRNFIQTMDPADGTAVQLTETLPSHRCLAAGVSAGESFYVIGGSTYTECAPTATSSTLAMTDEIVRIRLDPVRVEVLGTLPEALAASCAVNRADGKIDVFGGLHYVDDGAGGYDLEASDAVYVIDPSTGMVETHAARLPSPRSQMGCTRTSDDRTLLFGGAGTDGTPIDEVLHFEPYFDTAEKIDTLDAGRDGVVWQRLDVMTTEPVGTTLRYELRSGDEPTIVGAWTEVAPGDLPVDLLIGRYLEWRVSLGTSDPSVTPILHRLEVAFAY